MSLRFGSGWLVIYFLICPCTFNVAPQLRGEIIRRLILLPLQGGPPSNLQPLSKRLWAPLSTGKIMRARTTNSFVPFWDTQKAQGRKGLVKVATFNINNINKRLDNLLAWLAKAEPDVVSLQELKAEQEAFPVNALRTLGYEAVWQGERSWNGVAILARNHVPVLTCTSLPGNPEDH